MTGPCCFGRFILDPAKRTLYADGIPVALGSTDFRILLALVENAGTLVTKGQLISMVWGPVVVTDNALYFHISTLRKVLGQDLIKNEQRRGYRFLASVRRVESRAAPLDFESRLGNLPSLWTGNAADGPSRLIGRSEQLRILSKSLAEGRVVALTGPGGVGKTRLALQAANEASADFSDGAWLVELASVSDPELVPIAIASALGVQIGARATPLQVLSRFLARKSLLIVLDNCEHVIAAAARVSETLLSAAPGLKILATSREALSCAGEQIIDVPPLAVPSEGVMLPEMIRGVAAVDLFIERAMEADANFDVDDKDLLTVARICRRVDGLPLAIEMVAGWAGVLGLETLDAKLDGSLKAWLRARNTAPPRHCTLRATLEWSHSLLSVTEQTVLRRLAAFAGTFSMQGAEAVAGDDVIPKEQVFENVATLVRKSMIAVVTGSRPQRYRLLETTRALLLEELATAGEGDRTRSQHALHVLSMLEEAFSAWETTSDAAWLKRYSPVLDDVRAALDWAVDEQSDLVVALAGSSWPLWRELSLLAEGNQRLCVAATRLCLGTPPALEARLRHGLGEMLLDTPAMVAAHQEIERAAILFRELGDLPRLGSALTALGFSFFALDRIAEAEKALLEAIALLERAGSLRTMARAYSIQLLIKATSGGFNSASVIGEKAERLFEMVGAHRMALVMAANIVQLILEDGDVDRAVSGGRSLEMRLRDTHYSDLRGFVLGLLAAALTAQGDLDKALTAARDAAPLLRDEGTCFWLFDHLALRAMLKGRTRDATIIAGYADAIHQKNGRPRERMQRQAVERLNALSRDALPQNEVVSLAETGASLSEDQALTLALSG